MRDLGPRRPKDNPEVAVVILDVRIAGEIELVFAKPECVDKNPIVERLRLLKIGDRNVKVINAGDFGHV